jgi:CDP-diglyceride synthetase
LHFLPIGMGVLDRLDGIFAATPVFIVMVFFADLL